MEQFKTIEYTPCYGVTIQDARRFTDDEKPHYAEWYRNIGLVGISEHIELPYIKSSDMPRRPTDGEFRGCYNQAWIITEDEAARYIALNEERRAADDAQKEAETRQYMEEIITDAAKQDRLYTRDEARQKAKDYNNAYNEGGYGYVPHYYTIDEVERAKKWLAEH